MSPEQYSEKPFLIQYLLLNALFSFPGSNAEDIVRNYFNHRVNSLSKMRMRIVGDILVKVIYITVNVVALLILDGVLNNGFITYGVLWSDWAKLDNAVAYDYMGEWTDILKLLLSHKQLNSDSF